MGEIYVQVDASASNGIMTLDASGGGPVGGSYWLHWNVAGFIGHGWFYEDTILPITWEHDPGPADGYDATETGFMKYIGTLGEDDNLNKWLGTWDNASKWNFLQSHLVILGDKACVTSQ